MAIQQLIVGNIGKQSEDNLQKSMTLIAQAALQNNKEEVQ